MYSELSLCLQVIF